MTTNILRATWPRRAVHFNPTAQKRLVVAVKLALAALAATAGTGALADTVTVPDGGSNTTAQTVNAAGTGATVTIGSGASLSVNGLALNISGTAGTVNINNSGTIASINNTARAIDNNTNGVTVNITNTGTISSVLGDTIRINKSASSVHLINLGTIISGGNYPSSGGTLDTSSSGQALDFRAITASTGNTIQNGDATHTGALIQSNTEDAIRPGANTTITNYGTIITYSPMNTKDTTGL